VHHRFAHTGRAAWFVVGFAATIRRRKRRLTSLRELASRRLAEPGGLLKTVGASPLALG
jgi:hypothetical protein